MRWIKSPGTVDLTSVAVRGGLPTLAAGDYTGIFVGATTDSGGHQWVTVSTHNGAHTEQTSLDVSQIQPMAKIKFTIAAAGGAVAIMNGAKYKLVFPDETETNFMPMDELYKYIKHNNVQLAEPKLKSIETI